MSTLKELFDREKEEEAEAPLPPLPATETGSSSAKELTKKQGQKEETPVSPEKDTTSKELATISEESLVNEEADTFDLPVFDFRQSDISTGQVEPQVPKNSPEKEGLKSSETSSDNVVLEVAYVIEKLTVSEGAEGSKSIDEPPYYSDAKCFKTTEKSLSSPGLEYLNLGDAKGSLDSKFIEIGPGNEEASKSLESRIPTLKELLDREKEEEAEASLPPLPAIESGSSSAKELAEKQGQKEEIQLSPEKDKTSKELAAISEDSFVNEEAGTLDLPVVDPKQSDISTSRAEPEVPKNSLDKEGLKSSETSSDNVVLEGPRVIEKLTISEEAEGSKSIGEPPYYSDAESFKTTEKSLSSPGLEYSHVGVAKGSLESTGKHSGFLGQERSKLIEKGPGNGETSKSLESFPASAPEMTVKQPERAKKIARLQSVGVNLESLLDLNISPGVRSNVSGNLVSAESSTMMEEACERLKNSYVFYKGEAVGTLAAMDPSAEALNYNQVFVRDFVPSGLACLMKHPSEPEIVKNFLLRTLHLQGWEKRIDDFTLGKGVMPASFNVLKCPHRHKDLLIADFGGSAIGRVAPVDSGFWWIIMLRSYTKSTGDHTLVEHDEVQTGMRLILNLCLSDGFDTFPTLLCADGCSMIDRRMGIYGYPIEIQALFYFALRCAKQMLKPERNVKELLDRIDKRIRALSYHIQKYYWLDFTQLNIIYRYKTEEYSHTAVNKFNVIPESIPDWVFDFMPLRGGYLIGNVSPARMDFRWFLVGNCIAILSSLVTSAQATAIMDLVEERWEDLIGEMPLKITYPALEGQEWRLVTGYDPKNTRWSYHNGGSWPVLLWLLASACIKVGRPQMAKRAVELVEQRLSKDGWPEYYDGKTGRYVGKQARKYQTWSISGYLVAKLMIENPSNLSIIALEEDKNIAKPTLTRSNSF